MESLRKNTERKYNQLERDIFIDTDRNAGTLRHGQYLKDCAAGLCKPSRAERRIMERYFKKKKR